MSWLIKSSIGRKLVMSISGLALIFFLTFHMSMNLVALFSGDAYNAVCQFLGANWYALIGTMGLATLFIVHIIYAGVLTYQNRKARGNDRYAIPNRPKGVEWSSQNMMVLGVFVVLGIGIHLFHFWAKMQLPEVIHAVDTLVPAGIDGPADGARLIQMTFRNPYNVVLYIVWLGALWFHLNHGFWSALHTVGFNNNVWMSRLKVISAIYTSLIILGFLAVIVVYACGWNPEVTQKLIYAH